MKYGVWFGRLASALCLAGLLGCEKELGGRKVASLPDVLFISLDTLGAKHMSLYEYGRPTTPELDAFAADAVVFENVWANAPWTLPSYLSQFSGLYPEAFRLDGKDPIGDLSGGGPRFRLPDERHTLAEAFLDAGYRTAAWIDTPWLGAASGVVQGFEELDLSPALKPLGTRGDGLSGIAPRVLDWWAEENEGPSFAFVHAIDVHSPYAISERAPRSLPGEPYRPPKETVALTHVGGMYDTLHVHALQPSDHAEGARQIGDAVETRELSDRYDRGIAGADALLGELLAELDERHLLDNTIVLISSDHGEALGEHGWYFDHALVHEPTLSVPLIVRMPKRDRERGAVGRVTIPVQLVDLFPTLAELCGLNPEEKNLVGTSLAELLFAPTQAQEPRTLFAQGTMHEAAAVRRGPWKLVRRNHSETGLQTLVSDPRGLALLGGRDPSLFEGDWDVGDLLRKPGALEALRPHDQALREALGGWQLELFHLIDDPGEQNNLVFERPELAAELEAELLGFLDVVKAQRDDNRKFLESTGGTLSATERLRLIELGYLSAGRLPD